MKADLARNFSLYTVIGAVFYGLSVLLNGLFIDLLGFPTLKTSLVVLVGLFLLKFVVSVRLSVLRNRFRLYLISNLLLSLIAPFAVWLAVEKFSLPASLATAVILAIIFLLRYLVMGWLGLLNIENVSPKNGVVSK